jgi:mRNA interferase MazF
MIRRGDVYFVELGPAVGREQAGRRPVVVVSDDSINGRPLVATVVPGTDGRNVDEDYPVTVRVPASESGLPNDTVFLCFQMRSVDHARFVDPARGHRRVAGRVPPHRMAEIDAALRRALSL